MMQTISIWNTKKAYTALCFNITHHQSLYSSLKKKYSLSDMQAFLWFYYIKEYLMKYLFSAHECDLWGIMQTQANVQ